jgi:disulfide bond formation protein DsbB
MRGMTTDTPSKTVPPGPSLSLGDRLSLGHVLAEWPVAALIASVAMLAAAHAFETFGKLAPCHLCLKQREVYWAAAGLGLVAVALSRTAWADKVRRPLNLILALVFLFGAGLAVYHAGAEWKWWPGP